VWDGEGWIPFAVLPDGTGIPVPFGIGLMMVGVTPLGVPGPAQTAEAVPPPTRKPLGRDAVQGGKAWTPAGPCRVPLDDPRVQLLASRTVDDVALHHAMAPRVARALLDTVSDVPERVLRCLGRQKPRGASEPTYREVCERLPHGGTPLRAGGLGSLLDQYIFDLLDALERVGQSLAEIARTTDAFEPPVGRRKRWLPYGAAAYRLDRFVRQQSGGEPDYPWIVAALRYHGHDIPMTNSPQLIRKAITRVQRSLLR
jgi:hypothetical protein